MKTHAGSSIRNLGILAVALIACSSVSRAQSTLYATGFDPADGIATGNLNGQNAWSVDLGAATVTTGTGAQGSPQFVQLGANSTVTRTATSTDDHVLVRSYYQGSGSATLAPPSGSDPIAALVGFRTINASTIAIAAWNGTTNQWTEPAGPVAFSNTAWHQIVVALDYDARTFNVTVNGTPHLTGIGFRDNSVSQLNGLGIGSETSARVDSVGMYASGPLGDYDGDGWTDKYETAGGSSSPFLGTATSDYVTGNEPTLGDLNADNSHNATDYALLATAVSNGTASPATGDMNGDGNVDVRDVTHYGNRVGALVSIMR